MIVTINETNYDQYRNFLAEAYQYLDELNLIKDSDKVNGANTFTTLAQYFNYIEEIMQSDRKDYFLLKLPIDESAFLNIDANSRAINIPASFTKGAIVQSDKIAETVIFTINRFVDNIDLCNASKVYVQWTAPDVNGGVREWATEVELIDKESIPEKIKFGWTIDDEVTKYPGKVQFSVTFFIADEDSIEENAVVYRLNTLPATLDVKPALQPIINKHTKVNHPGDALNTAIKNNKYPGVGKVNPITPEFNTPGLDLKEEELLVNNKLTLKAQAVTPDTGIVYYTWYFVPEGSEFQYKCGLANQAYSFEPQEIDSNGEKFLVQLPTVDYELLDSESKKYFENKEKDEKKPPIYMAKDAHKNSTLTLKYNQIGTVYEGYSPAINANNPDKRDVFYIKVGDGYQLATGSEDEASLPKFEKYSFFDLPSTGDVVGYYFVDAYNAMGSGVSYQTSNTKSSQACVLSSPESINITQDFKETEFLETPRFFSSNERLTAEQFALVLDEYKNKFTESNGSYYPTGSAGVQAVLRQKELAFAITERANTSFKYDWYHTLDKDQKNFTKIESNGKTNKIVLNDGWYKVNISASKNRKELSEDTETCRVVSAPVSPVLTIKEFEEGKDNVTSVEGVWYDQDEPNGYYSINISKGQSVTLHVDAKVMIDEKDQTDNKIYSDKIKYEWRVMSGLGEDATSVILNTTLHGNRLPKGSNQDFRDKGANESFSDHPSHITYEYDNNPVVLACYAMNTLAGRDTAKNLSVVRFLIS